MLKLMPSFAFHYLCSSKNPAKFHMIPEVVQYKAGVGDASRSPGPEPIALNWQQTVAGIDVMDAGSKH